MAKQRFVYKAPTTERVRERANQKSRDYDRPTKPGIKLYKPREGKNRIRIMPNTWEPGGNFDYKISLVYGIGPDKAAYLSLSEMKTLPDPIDEAYRAAVKEGDDQLAKDLRPKTRAALWLIDRLAEDEGPQLWLAPFTVASDVYDLTIDKDAH
jgi:hypothetical protein